MAGDVSIAGRVFEIRGKQLYLMLLRLVAKDSLATNAALHQLEPSPLGLIAVTLVVPVAVWSLVKALQSPLLRLVS